MIRLGDDLRIAFTYQIQRIAKNGSVPMTVIRQSKRMLINVPLSNTRPLLMPNLIDDYPPYFIFGPLVFESATGDFVNGYTSNVKYSQPLINEGSELIARRIEKPSFPGEELVVVSSPFFPHDLVKGYANVNPRIVESVNGIKVRNLRHLVEILRDARAEFLTFEFDGLGGESLVFNRKEMLDATDGILNDNGVRAQGPEEILAIWHAKRAS
jgi:hypothetical protein